MAFKDLREFINTLEKEGELIKVKKEVDWREEAGAITRRCCEINGPATLFENIKDYPEGYRLAGGTQASYRRIAIAMGINPDSSYTDIVEEYIKRSSRPIKPILVNNGLCKENIFIGEDVDLFRLPAPLIHANDGGRYISTWHFITVKDPDSDWVNWGMYRQMIVDEKNMTGVFIRFQHMAGMFYEKFKPRNKPLEFATCIGTEPISALVASSSVPVGVSEVDIVGGLRESPVELVKCETVNLYVPATSEIVIEGEISPTELADEGPFGEYPGYLNEPRRPMPVYHVKAITHRNDPILTFSNMGMPIDEGHTSFGIHGSAQLTQELRKNGIPIKGVVNVVAESAIHLIAVSTETPYSGIPFKIASTIWNHKAGAWTPYVIVCDSDVDASNMNEVIHALATKCHPERGITIIKNTPQSLVFPASSLHEKLYSIGPKCLFDCTWPKDWPDTTPIPIKSSFNMLYSNEVKKKVLENWKEYGFK
jgi:4-hydroxy-3-polyprenylbenzoate decarboxylase